MLILFVYFGFKIKLNINIMILQCTKISDCVLLIEHLNIYSNCFK